MAATRSALAGAELACRMNPPRNALHDALRGAGQGVAGRPPAAPGRRVLVAGGGGPLGSAVLERLLGSGAWDRVAVLVEQPIEVAMRGLEAWPTAWLAPNDAPPNPLPVGWRIDPPGWRPDTAVVVFDRERGHNRREVALHRPLPGGLPALARGLRALGVTRLVQVMPHAPGLLPQALRAGLASLDELAVSALGFEQLVLVRPAHLGEAAVGAGGALPRLGRALLGQLHWMVPQREQPLRPAKVAQFVAELAQGLPAMAAGTRVVPPELLWDWSQPGAGPALLQAWLQGRAGPAPARVVPSL